MERDNAGSYEISSESARNRIRHFQLEALFTLIKNLNDLALVYGYLTPASTAILLDSVAEYEALRMSRQEAIAFCEEAFARSM